MKPQSAKAKGRRLQQQFRELLIEELGIHPEDIESRTCCRDEKEQSQNFGSN